MPLIKKLLLRALGLWYNITALVARGWTGRRLDRLFCTPPPPRIRLKERAFLDEAVVDLQTLRDFGGVVYHWGNPQAPYILMAYGWGYNAGRWRHYAPQLLEAGYRLVAFDPPGHGQANAGLLTLPENAALIRRLLEVFGPPKAVLAHSFGGGSTIEALADLPAPYHPERMVVMASFSRATWIFQHLQYVLGLTEYAFRGMVTTLEGRIERQLTEFDLARRSARLDRTKALIVHDPEDSVTHFRNAERYHSYWPGSSLLVARKVGHHLASSTLTRQVIAFLQNGTVPAEARPPKMVLPADHDLIRFFAGLETGAVERPVRIP